MQRGLLARTLRRLPDVAAVGVLELADRGLRGAVHDEVRVGAVACLHGECQVDQLVGRARGREGAGGTCRDEAEVAPRPRGVGDGRVGEEALRLVDAVAGDEGGAFLLGEGVAHLLGDPLVDVDGAVVEECRRRRRHGIELHGRERQRIERRRRRLRTRGRLADPAGAEPVHRERLLVDGARDLRVAGDGADRRDGAECGVDRRSLSPSARDSRRRRWIRSRAPSPRARGGRTSRPCGHSPRRPPCAARSARSGARRRRSPSADGRPSGQLVERDASLSVEARPRCARACRW